jgi:hypothetical protein
MRGILEAGKVTLSLRGLKDSGKDGRERKKKKTRCSNLNLIKAVLTQDSFVNFYQVAY